MSYIKKILVLFIIFFYSQNYSYANQKVAYIDINFIMNNSNIGIKLLKKLEKTNKSNLKTLNTKKDEILKQKNDIEKTKNVLSKEELKNKIKNQKKNISEFNDIKKNLSKEINLIKEKETKKIITKINPLLEDYMKKNSIEILLRKESIYLSKNENDITKDVLNLVNQKLK